MRSAVNVCLDSYALLAWLGDEPGSGLVDRLLADCESGTSTCHLSTINLGEIYYILARRAGEPPAERFWTECTRGILPIRLATATAPRIRAAARIKAQFPVAYADAFAVATALAHRCPLVTADPEIQRIAPAVGLHLLWDNP
ncbi:MAG TPA: type II toxin-antitoxin system VapC family toxin [Acidobacteria bacterium]|nr:type II toxin-antitoxin system VapC family toxin [Acidobacteriota bacterium]